MTGALVAVAVGWGSILLVTRLPLDQLVHRRHVQAAGGIALAVLGLGLLGLPLPAHLAVLALLGVPLIGRLVAGAPARPK